MISVDVTAGEGRYRQRSGLTGHGDRRGIVVTRDHRGWGKREGAGGCCGQTAEVDFEDFSAPLRDDRATGEVQDRDRDLAARAHDRVLGRVERLSSSLPDDDPA